MTKKEIASKLIFEGDANLIINGQPISLDDLKETYFQKVYKTAMINKNRRESDNGGIKQIVQRGLTLNLLSKDEALDIILFNDKEKANEIKAKFPVSEKSEEPNEEDVDQAIATVLAGGGQAVSA